MIGYLNQRNDMNNQSSKHFKIADQQSDTASGSLEGLHKGNIENFIGYAQIPVGKAGPLYINGLYAQGKYDIPLATTEGALVASYSRGMKACRLAGGISAMCVEDHLERAPYFKFLNIKAAASFVKSLDKQFETYAAITRQTSNYCTLRSIDYTQEGNAVTVFFSFKTGDAAGQNMTTIATDAICKYILASREQEIIQWYIESNAGGDKKATRRSLSKSRGRKVIAEVTISRDIVSSVLKSTPEHMCHYYNTATLSSIQVGAIGNTGHIANGLTALFIACGQDVACVSESAAGILRMELTSNGDLYAALTLPALAVGTVGGGTSLPSPSTYLDMIACKGEGQAQKFAEICAATALAGELSIAAAIAEDHFTAAHQLLGRK